MNPKQHGFRSDRSSYWSVTTGCWRNLKRQTMLILFARFSNLDKVDHITILNKLKKMESTARSVCGYTIFYQTENN